MDELWFLIPTFILTGGCYFVISRSNDIAQTEVNKKNKIKSDKAYITIIIWVLRSIKFLLLICITWFFCWGI